MYWNKLLTLLLCLYFLPCLSLAATNCQTQFDIPETECLALLDFHTATGGDDWTDAISNGWGVTQSPCTWSGVFCANDHVIQLLRNDKGLTGEIPDLSALTEIKIISLQQNSLEGGLDSLLAVSSLVTLRLGGNTLSGTIPDLSSLTLLQNIQLSNNQFEGAFPTVPTSLISINFEMNQLSGTIPDLSALRGLQTFDVSNNEFSGDSPVSLASLPLFGGCSLQNNPDLGECSDLLSDKCLCGIIPSPVLSYSNSAPVTLSRTVPLEVTPSPSDSSILQSPIPSPSNSEPVILESPSPSTEVDSPSESALGSLVPEESSTGTPSNSEPVILESPSPILSPNPSTEVDSPSGSALESFVSLAPEESPTRTSSPIPGSLDSGESQSESFVPPSQAVEQSNSGTQAPSESALNTLDSFVPEQSPSDASSPIPAPSNSPLQSNQGESETQTLLIASALSESTSLIESSSIPAVPSPDTNPLTPKIPSAGASSLLAAPSNTRTQAQASKKTSPSIAVSNRDDVSKPPVSPKCVSVCGNGIIECREKCDFVGNSSERKQQCCNKNCRFKKANRSCSQKEKCQMRSRCNSKGECRPGRALNEGVPCNKKKGMCDGKGRCVML